MGKRRKTSRSAFCNSLCKDNQKLYRCKDCVFIGKENIEKWNDLKIKSNFSSDHEFASCLLDSFLAVRSSSLNKVSKKEVSNKSDTIHSTSSNDLVPNYIDNDSSIHKTLVCENSTSEKGNNSTVIVINRPKRTDNSSTEVPDICKSSTSLCIDEVLTQDAIEPCEIDISSDMSANRKSKSNQICSKSKSNLISEANPKTESKSKKHMRNRRDVTKSSVLINDKKSYRQQKKKLKSVSKRLPTDNEDGQHKVQSSDASMKVETVESEFVAETESEQSLEPEQCERVTLTSRLCTECELHHLPDACPLRNPIHKVSDTVCPVERLCAREPAKSLAEASLPPCLELQTIDSRHGLSVVAGQNVQAFTQFGPLVGQPVSEKEIPDDSTMEHIWELSDGNTCCYLTTSDPSHSNWLRYIRPAATRSSRNLEVILRDSQLMFVTTIALNAGDELFYWAENTNSAWSQKKLCKTKCGGCNLSFSHTLYYRLHCAVFHDPAYSLTVRKYHCKVCGMSVLGKENIVKHAAEKHNGKGAYQCQYCQKFFLRLNYLEMHRTYGCSANPNRARPLCDYCGRKFCQPQKLKVHIKRMHSEMLEVLREFQCKHCLKVLGSRAALQRHNKEVHQRDIVGAFTCDRCGKMFQNKSNLKIHMLTHSGVKPFKCKEADCQAAFTTKQCLQFHYRKVHGLAESVMPPIERSIEYTFDAYAGGRRPSSVNSDSLCSSEGEDSPEKYLNEEPSQLSPLISVTSDAVHDPGQDTFNHKVVTKGSKKWIGGAADSAKTNIFDFDEDDKDQDINVSQIEGEPTPMLFHNCKQDSSNASLLVEAALDAAEREIHITSKLPSPIALVTNKDFYPELRSHMTHSPLSLSRPVSPGEYTVPEQSQSPPLPMETCYSTPMSPRHPYSLMFPERTSHYEFRLSPPPGQMDAFHLEDSRYDIHHRRTEESSNDEGVNVVQNLSLGMKNKPLQLDIPYKYDSLEDRAFECTEGLDMSRTGGYHHSFVSMTPRYPPTLYEPRTYSHTDVLRVVNFSHSVDLSLPRSHHQLTPPMSQAMIEPIRLISPPPPPYQAYPLATSPSPYSRAPHSPSYHHYNASY